MCMADFTGAAATPLLAAPSRRLRATLRGASRALS